jgi:hypothetical protein
LIAGIVAAITAIAIMATAAVAFSQSIQNAHYVNTSTQNVSYAFQQVAIYEKINILLNLLEAALLSMGDEAQTLKFHQDLLCHTGFQHSCVLQHLTAHVMEAWENNNDSLNLQNLRQQILAMQQAHDQVSAPADVAKTILDELQGLNPFSTVKYSFWYFIGIVLLMMCCFCLLSVRTRKIKRQVLRLNIEIHWSFLRNRVGGDVGDQV